MNDSPLRGALATVLVGAIAATVVLSLPARTHGRAAAAGPPHERQVREPDTTAQTDIEGSCRTARPFYAVAILAATGTRGPEGDLPAVLAFREGTDEGGSRTEVLATRAQVGDVYGLAYDHARGHLYAASYLRAGGAFGPGGPGQIYRIDVESREVTAWVKLDAGVDRHDEPDGGASWVGRTGLADIDISDDGSELYAVTLDDKRVVRLGLPDGTPLGSFRHGGTSLSFERDVWPFGLGWHDGWLYHGSVNSHETDPPRGPEQLFLFRSRPDGSQMQSVLFGAAWSYPRKVAWSRWRPDSDGRTTDSPMLVDIAFGEDGLPVLGLRDRQVDMAPGCLWDPACAAGPSAGDLLPVRPNDADLWTAVTRPAWFQDTGPDDFDLTFGALAAVPGVDLFVSPSRPADGDARSSWGRLHAHWFALGSGARARGTPLLDARGEDGAPSIPGAAPGDIEVLCGPADETGGAAAGTATAEAAAVATATADADLRRRATERVAYMTVMAPTVEARGTAAAATAAVLQPTLVAEAPTATAAAASAAGTVAAAAPRLAAAARGATEAARLAAAATPLPPARQTQAARARRAVLASCGGPNPYLATTRFVPPLDGAGRPYGTDWLSEQPAVVVFHDTERDDLSQQHVLAYQPEVGAVFGVAQDLKREHIYFGAYIKRLAELGPLGPGGIYRYELATGRMLPWAKLDAGLDPHRISRRDFDQAAAEYVGRAGLGDLELWPEGDELLVVNLSDKLIYRLSVPDGHVLGAFAHGAAGQDWAEDAVPFALAVRDGWLYHGVTDTRARDDADARRLAAYVYRSRPDGSEMTEVARLHLDYPRSPAWQSWAIAHDEADPRREPVLTDIEFRVDDDLLLGLRDRYGDARVLVAGGGDMVLTTRLDDRWYPMPDPELYNDNIRHAESSWGTLAALPWLDEVVSTVIDPVEIYSGGAAWYSNRDGGWKRLETVYAGANVTFGKASGLGDIESLCEELPPPPTFTPTHTPTRTPTATPTATDTPTITPTPTRGLWTVYLPIVRREPCIPESIYADAVLVLDMSTSMYRPTASNRTKHEAAIGAARLFVDELDLEPDESGGRDRVAIVGFNDTAWTQADLTSDRAAIDAALDGLLGRIAEGTRLDLALAEGQAAIDRAERIGDNQPVLILLTDGLPNRVPTPAPIGSQEATVLAVSREVKAKGTRVFTVGLGLKDDVLDALLSSVASAPRDYYFAPDGDDLAAIYRQIAGRIVECP